MYYESISNVSETILRLLQIEMVPEFIGSDEAIIVASPADVEGKSISLSIHLYDIAENKYFRDFNNMEKRSICVDLYYMITAYSHADIMFKALEEQKILNKAMGSLFKNLLATKSEIGLSGHSKKDKEVLEKYANLSVEILDNTLEEKISLWAAFGNKSFKQSIYYKVSNVELYEEENKVSYGEVQELILGTRASMETEEKTIRRVKYDK